MLAVLRNALYMWLNLCPLVQTVLKFMTSYGGILERGAREYTLDDFHVLALDRLDRYTCLREAGVVFGEGEESGSGSSCGDDDSKSGSGSKTSSGASELAGGGEDEEARQAEASAVVEEEIAPAHAESGSEWDAAVPATADPAVRMRAEQFLSISRDKNAQPTDDDIFGTPQPGETTAKYFTRSRTCLARPPALAHSRVR